MKPPLISARRSIINDLATLKKRGIYSLSNIAEQALSRCPN